MAKKPASKPADQHRSNFLVRLPEAYRPILEELKRKTGRPTTVEIQWALNAHLEKNGIELPESTK